MAANGVAAVTAVSSANARSSPTGSGRRASRQCRTKAIERPEMRVSPASPGGSSFSTAVIVSTDVVRVNGDRPDEHLVQHDAEREDVRSVIEDARRHLLR